MSTSAIQTPIIIGCDHAAYPLKEKVKIHLIHKGIDVVDVGTDNEESVDYSDFGAKVASQVSSERLWPQKSSIPGSKLPSRGGDIRRASITLKASRGLNSVGELTIECSIF